MGPSQYCLVFLTCWFAPDWIRLTQKSAVLLLTSLDSCCWRKRQLLPILNFESPEFSTQWKTCSCFTDSLAFLLLSSPFQENKALFLPGTKNEESCQMPKHKKSLDCEDKEISWQNMHYLPIGKESEVQEKWNHLSAMVNHFSHFKITFRWSLKQNSFLK